MMRWFLCLTLGIAPPEAQSAEQLRTQILELFDAKRHAEAAEVSKEAFERTDDVAFLYAWAQAERLQGDCQRAIGLYGRVLDRVNAGPMADDSRANLETCAKQLERSEPEPLPEPVPEPEPEPPRIADDPVRPKPWWKDPAGGALVGVGAVAVAAGGGVLVAGSARRRSADGQEEEQRFIDGHAEARRLTIAGAIVTGIGGALMIAGVVRYAVIGRRARSRTAARWPLTIKF